MLMSKSEYARHRGVSRQTIYDWIAKGDVVMSGSKIDVEATERQQQNVDEATSENTTVDPWPHRTLEMTWSNFWEAVKASDGKSPAPKTDEEIQKRVADAADELGVEVSFLDDGGICLEDCDAEYYFEKYDLRQNAELAVMALRRELLYTSTLFPDEVSDWSPAGLEALSTWAKA
ncbi:hypothetical protein JEM67_22595 [Serratia sp. PAMC26656]|uniref:hypothetical protein n=1 Tax=Serratia sp. PAMC26656 TaxID=2775909 RepID=UPI0018F47837|nr:hypothetical protein [Serratia sp. PAMC26656]MBJ7892827.1 hypothetical protein [Serratia sp. PAMC26656]